MPETEEPLNPPGPVCWRCQDAMVLEFHAGERKPCPACFDRPNRRSLQVEVMRRCRPRARYRLARTR